VRVLFAGGGTGGHLYPALAVAQHLRRTRRDFECIFLGAENGLEREIVPREGFTLHAIPGSGFRRLGLGGRLRFFWSLARGLLQAVRLVWRWRPDVVLATGGYASLAGGLAALFWRKPLAVQEQNRIPGMATRLLGRMARRIYVGFPGTESAFRRRDRVVCVGNPVREQLQQPSAPPPGLPAGAPVILIVGGSRGARSINGAVDAAIPLVAAHVRVTWLWQTGRLDHEELAARWRDEESVSVREFLPDMAAAYAAATLVVCRSGAMTLAEITLLGKPAILVPFPGAVDDHQTANARVLTAAGAAILLPDADLSGEKLAREVSELLRSGERLAQMATRSRQLGRPDATRELAADLLRLSGKSGEEAHVRAG
jgi:UDP-N-acetylglucosamine--N-acetylmuramyl-(pentapeptide) pyrophosphoryl-undecaprenol N-acetylglucosamine transferase